MIDDLIKDIICGDIMGNKNKNSFLIIWGSCLVILLILCYFNFNVSFKNIGTSFGGITGQITIPSNITYYSNYPDGFMDATPVVKSDKKEHIVLDNLFDIPSGYQFVGWTMDSSGSGDLYISGNVIPISDDIELYAKWDLAPEPELVPAYGDVNKNGEIDTDDYLFLEKYVLGTNSLDEQAILNADVNEDGKIDNIDVDIIKQAYLGTSGYTGYLPNKPLLIYEIYKEFDQTDEDNISGDVNGSEDGKDEDNDNDDDVSSEDKENIESNGSGTGSGTSGSGSNSSGSGENNPTADNQPGSAGTGSSSSSSGRPGNASSSGGQSSSSTEKDNKNDNDDDSSSQDEINDDSQLKPEIFEFKFISGKKEYSTTKCDVLGDGTCILVLPDSNPTKKRYTFSGWSKTKDCPKRSGITTPVMVQEGATYYACFIENEDNDNENKDLYAIIVVVGLSLISGRIIWHLISRFKKEQVKIESDDNSEDN